MPEFTYAGQVPVSYAEQRDSDGLIVGTVEHGDTRDFALPDGEKPEDAPGWWGAPDGRWVPAATEIAAAWPGVSAGMYRDQPAEDDDGGEDAAPGAGPESPLPAEDAVPVRLEPDSGAAAPGETPTPAGTGQEDEG